ncbi:MAG TPA: hypothetical protein VFV37_10960 [Luteibaculaceae bacterium]|nr:hypothetical protein [Luteibaculaceae bacterium]
MQERLNQITAQVIDLQGYDQFYVVSNPELCAIHGMIHPTVMLMPISPKYFKKAEAESTAKAMPGFQAIKAQDYLTQLHTLILNHASNQ